MDRTPFRMSNFSEVPMLSPRQDGSPSESMDEERLLSNRGEPVQDSRTTDEDKEVVSTLAGSDLISPTVNRIVHEDTPISEHGSTTFPQSGTTFPQSGTTFILGCPADCVNVLGCTADCVNGNDCFEESLHCGGPLTISPTLNPSISSSVTDRSSAQARRDPLGGGYSERASRNQLQRQSEVDETSSLESASQRSPPGHFTFPDRSGKTTGANNKPSMKLSSSFGQDASRQRLLNDAKSKFNKGEHRCHSLETPSITIKIEDVSASDKKSRPRHFSADQPCRVRNSALVAELENSGLDNTTYEHDSELDNTTYEHDSELDNTTYEHDRELDNTTCEHELQTQTYGRPATLPPAFKGSLSLPTTHAAQPKLCTRSVGRATGNKLKACYSLDVPSSADVRTLSLSLSTLVPHDDDSNRRPAQRLKYPVVEDKLISSSMSRLDHAAGKRRLSWTPGYSPRGSIQSSQDVGDGKVQWTGKKGQSLSEYHSSTPTLDALVAGIAMASYERFDQNAHTLPGGTTKSPEGPNGDGIIKDSHIQIENDGKVMIFGLDNKESAYISDPAGDPYAPKTGLQKAQGNVQRIVENFYFRAFTVILILLDFIVVIIDLAENDCASNEDALEIISHVIICYFIVEIAARIFIQGKRFFYNILDVLDFSVVLISFIVDVVFLALSDHGCASKGRMAQLVVIGRVVRAIRVVRIVYIMIVQHRQVARATRQMVSQNKRRYQRDGFDLDLCYITERVIAMSFPSKGMMALYRNPVAEVARFFNTKHKGHYRIYNLCSERDYNENLFFNNVERVYIDDHNVPKLREMLDFTANAREWMAMDKQNVIAIHCKGGKGRTGTLICTWLIDCGLLESAQESLEYFGDRRTDLSKGSTFQGVETPSQSRYVEYFEKLKNFYNKQLPPKKVLKLKSIKITGINSVGNGDGTDLFMELRQDGLLIFECNLGTQVNCEVLKYTDSDSIVMNLKNCPNIHGDIKIMFKTHNKKIPIGYDKCPFYFWFYTSFIEDNHLYIPRDELDNPHKSKTHNVFRENFGVELSFEAADDS